MSLWFSLTLISVVVMGAQGFGATAHESPISKLGQGPNTAKFNSPDGKLIATVVSTSQKENESRIQIFTKSEFSVLSKDFGSKDGQHGKSFCKGAWTPNSKFFVWSMESSGGHQPWHFPTYYFDRKKKSVESLDAIVGGITTPDFKLQSPDIIEGSRLRNKVQNDPFKASLSQLRG